MTLTAPKFILIGLFLSKFGGWRNAAAKSFCFCGGKKKKMLKNDLCYQKG